jgi:hypothetical protein
VLSWLVSIACVSFKLITAEQKKSCLRESDPDADIAKVLTMDEARRIASNIAKLPTVLLA